VTRTPRTIRTALAASVLTALLPLGTDGPAAAAPVHEEWGWTAGTNGVLLHGCHRYTYRYSVDVTTESWALEVTVLDPDREAVASETLHAETEPASGRRSFRLCRASTEPGRFAIRAKVVTIDGWTIEEGMLPRSRFRLRSS